MLASQSLWLAAHAFWIPSSPGSWQSIVMTQWPLALATAAVTFVVLFPLWRFRAMGAGDVKFAAVLGFCMGPLGLLQAFLIGSALAGAHSVLYVLQQQTHWLQGRMGSQAVPQSTPYAAYLALGVLFGVAWQVLNAQPWLQRLVWRG
jgi:prepilin peptidase CpaA